MSKELTAEQIEAKRTRERIVVHHMIEAYCRGKHGTRRGSLCHGMRATRRHAYIALPLHGHKDVLFAMPRALLYAREAPGYQRRDALCRSAHAATASGAGCETRPPWDEKALGCIPPQIVNEAENPI